MSKININNVNNFDSIKGTSQTDVKRPSAEQSVSVDSKNTVKNADKVEISGRASEVTKFVDALKELPDVRAEKVNELSDKISSGDFNPSSEEIADAILKDES